MSGVPYPLIPQETVKTEKKSALHEGYPSLHSLKAEDKS